jgi:hypothetical protein
MRTVGLIILALLIVAASWLGSPAPAQATGPWKAQLVSAETKKPLRRVVVVAFWTKNVRTSSGPTSEYRFSEETSTDSNGRFTIEARSFFSFHPSVSFQGPFFVFFKAGYGQARWPGQEETPGPEPYAALLQRGGIVLEMPTLRSVGERTDYLKAARGNSAIVPRDRTPLLNSAIADERKTITLK